jgi:predicted Mrr-cat superfamily restriction endonuclease
MTTRQAWLTRTGEGGFGLADCIRQGVVALKASDTPERFANEMQVGDIVVTPHAEERRVFFGEVTGEYVFDDAGPIPALPHTRAVRWLGDVARDAIPAERRKELDFPSTFYVLQSTDDWLQRAAVATGDHVSAPKTRLAPAAARAKLPKPVEAATAKCTVCNMTVTPTDVVDGVCDFCR